MSCAPRPPRGMRGFTLIEVLVALVIVAFGMSAVLAALNASAVNVAGLREKTLAQWVALNRIADVRLNLQPPQTGTTEGDVNGFANGNWHWQQIVSNVQEIPGLMQVTVKVRRTAAGVSSSSSGISTGSSSSGVSSKDADWVTTVIGFRGTSIAPGSGEVPDWTGAATTGTTSSSSGSGSSSGSILNPGTSTGTSSGTTTSPTTTPSLTGNSSSGGN